MGREDNKRGTRVGERIREELMELLLRGAVKDPGVSGVLVSAVRVSDDLSVARVYVRLLTGGDASAQRRALDALGRASGYLRRELARRLQVRAMPELRFHWDDVVDSGIRMETLLEEIRTESKDRGEGGES